MSRTTESAQHGFALQPRGPHQEIPGRRKQRQAKPGTCRVRGQGKCSPGATSVCKRELGSLPGVRPQTSPPSSLGKTTNEVADSIQLVIHLGVRIELRVASMH